MGKENQKTIKNKILIKLENIGKEIKKIYEIIKNKILIIAPFSIGLGLLSFFIYNDLYLKKEMLTNEWMTIVLGLFIISLIPSLLNEIILKKLEEYRVKEIIDDFVIKNLYKNEKLNNLEAFSKEVTENNSSIKVDKIDNDSRLAKVLNSSLNEKNKNKVSFFKGPGKDRYGLKTNVQIVIVNQTLSLRVNQDNIDNKNDFENYLTENSLGYFSGKLKIDTYGRTSKTATDYKWIRFKNDSLSETEDKLNEEDFKDNFEKLIDLVIKNNS